MAHQLTDRDLEELKRTVMIPETKKPSPMTSMKVGPIQKVDKCRCGNDATIDVRGEKLCIHCHLDRIWDYIEENRRMIIKLGMRREPKPEDNLFNV